MHTYGNYISINITLVESDGWLVRQINNVEKCSLLPLSLSLPRRMFCQVIDENNSNDWTYLYE